MPTNKKEGIIFGICICVIMVFFMGLLNISIHLGGILVAGPISRAILKLIQSKSNVEFSSIKENNDSNIA